MWYLVTLTVFICSHGIHSVLASGWNADVVRAVRPPDSRSHWSPRREIPATRIYDNLYDVESVNSTDSGQALAGSGWVEATILAYWVAKLVTNAQVPSADLTSFNTTVYYQQKGNTTTYTDASIMSKQGDTRRAWKGYTEALQRSASTHQPYSLSDMIAALSPDTTPRPPIPCSLGDLKGIPNPYAQALSHPTIALLTDGTVVALADKASDTAASVKQASSLDLANLPSDWQSYHVNLLSLRRQDATNNNDQVMSRSVSLDAWAFECAALFKTWV